MLSQTTETDPQQCGLRALHVFLSDVSSHETFFKREGIKIVLSSLKSPDPVVISSALKVIERMSWFDAFPKQLKDIDSGYDSLLNLTLHLNPKIQHAALHALLLCSKFSDCCSSIATPEGIGLFLRHLQQIQDMEVKSFIGQILCYCCWNVLCRNRMIQCMGVAKMIEMLGDSDFHRLHDKVLSALMCYYYNEPGLKEMVDMGLVTVLIQTLSSIVEIEMPSNVDDTVTEMRTDPIEEKQADLQSCVNTQMLSVSVVDKQPSDADDTVTETRTDPIEEKQADLQSCVNTQMLSVSDVDKQPSDADDTVTEMRTDPTEEEQVDLQSCVNTQVAAVSDADKQDMSVSESDIQQVSVSDTDKLQMSASDTNKQVSVCSPEKYPSLIFGNLMSSTKIKKFPGSLSPIGYRQHFDSSPAAGFSPPSDLSSPCSPEARSPTSQEPISPQGPVYSQAELTGATPAVNMHPMEQRLLSLLSRVSLIKECIPAFLSQDVLKVLVGYVRSSPHPHPKAMRILERLAENRGCFEHLILQQAVPMIYHQFCVGERRSTGLSDNLLHGHRLLNILGCSAKSGYGQGLIAHKLIRGSEKEVKWYALSLPYLCQSKEVCQKLCMRYKGLESLMNLLRQGTLSDQEMEFAVCGLRLLARNLMQPTCFSEDVGTPPAKTMKLEEMSDDKEESGCSYEVAIRQGDLKSKRLIKLRLDSGKAIICCQDVLVNRSDYFHAMLLGSFREYDAQCVDLPGVDYQALLAVVHSLHGCSWTCKTVIDDGQSAEPKTENADEDNNMDSTDNVCSLGLRVIALTNQLLLTGLSEECQSVVSSCISSDNLVELFHFSCMHVATFLNIQCVQQWLEMSNLQLQIKILRRIMESQDRDALLSRITCLLSR